MYMYVVSTEFEQLAKRYASIFYISMLMYRLYVYTDMEMYWPYIGHGSGLIIVIHDAQLYACT